MYDRMRCAVLLAAFVMGSAFTSAPLLAQMAEPEPDLKSTADLDAPQTGTGPWSFSADMALVSKYVWRGQNVTDGLVLQPNVAVGYEGFSAGVWGNWEMEDVNGRQGDFTELDYTFGYDFQWEMLSVSTGYIYYDFPGGGPDTQELYLGLGLDVPLNPSVTVYWDVDQANGTYIAFGLGHSFEEIVRFDDNTAMGMDLGVTLGHGSPGYNEFYFGEDDPAFGDLTLSMGLPIGLGDKVTVTPNLNWSTLLDSGIRRGATEDDNVFGGVTVSIAF